MKSVIPLLKFPCAVIYALSLLRAPVALHNPSLLSGIMRLRGLEGSDFEPQIVPNLFARHELALHKTSEWIT